jgi:hypothetical protein
LAPERPQLIVGWVSTSPALSELAVRWGSAATQHFSARGPGCFSWDFDGRLPPDLASAPLRDVVLQVELVRGEGALDYVTVPGRGP